MAYIEKGVIFQSVERVLCHWWDAYDIVFHVVRSSGSQQSSPYHFLYLVCFVQ